MPYVPAGPVFTAFAFVSVAASSVFAAGSVLVAFNNASFSTSAPFRIRRESRSASCGMEEEINSLFANSQRNLDENNMRLAVYVHKYQGQLHSHATYRWKHTSPPLAKMLQLPALASVFLLLPAWPWPPAPLSRLTAQVGSRGTTLSAQEVTSATSKVAVECPPV